VSDTDANEKVFLLGFFGPFPSFFLFCVEQPKMAGKAPNRELEQEIKEAWKGT
jgi:hypothetical protein